MAWVASKRAVIAPIHATTSKNAAASNAAKAKNNGPILATRKTPAFTIVAA